MSLSQPSSPNPAITAAIQGQQNQAAAVNNSILNNVNQVTPFGSLSYAPIEGPTGVPTWTAVQQLTGPAQGLLNQYQGNQSQIAGNAGQQLSLGQGLNSAAGQLLNNDLGNINQAPNFLAQSSPLVQAQMGAFQNYMQPFYNMQSSNLNSMLQNQGIPQGSQAWNNAQMGFNTSQDQAAQSALMNFEPQAFNQAVQNYQLPIQALGNLLGMGSGQIGSAANTAAFGSPTGLNTTFAATPLSGNIAPANYAGYAQNNFQNLQNQFQNTSSSLTGLAQGLGLLGTGASGGSSGLGGLLGSAASGVGGLFGLGSAAAPAAATGGGLFGDAAVAALGLI